MKIPWVILLIVWGVILGCIAFILIVANSKPARSQERHSHPSQDEPLHERWYRTWMFPDDPARSCCSKSDCYPTEVRYENERWYMKRREDGAWLHIPATKIERHRDAPDARAHLCAPPPRTPAGDIVFCASLGNGI